MDKKKKMTTAALLMMAVLGMVSCGTSKKAQQEGLVATNAVANKGVAGNNAMNDNAAANNAAVDNTPSIDKMGEEMDNGFLILSDAQREVVRKNNAFALRLFNKVSGMSSQVISPMSVAYLMGMLANGADGATQQEILKAIGCEGVSVKDLNETYQAILQTADKLDKQTSVNIANYIAVNQKFSANPDFKEKVATSYQARVESLDFSSPSTLGCINGWCSDKTYGMIPKIIDQVEPSAVSYWMNAIYFSGTWQEKFDAHDTKQENFRGYTRNIQKVDMMHQVAKFLYSENDIFKAIDLPYGNGTYRMLVLLPNEGRSIPEMMMRLSADNLAGLSNNMERCMVNLKLPKFTIEQELPLNDIISQLGAPSMFEPGKANFSNFANGDFFVSKMLQKAKIEVSEQGTKAAAVSAAIMLMSAAPMELRHVEFHADRPFVYLIQDTQSGGILFMGQFTGIKQ